MSVRRGYVVTMFSNSVLPRSTEPWRNSSWANLRTISTSVDTCHTSVSPNATHDICITHAVKVPALAQTLFYNVGTTPYFQTLAWCSDEHGSKKDVVFTGHKKMRQQHVAYTAYAGELFWMNIYHRVAAKRLDCNNKYMYTLYNQWQ